ncbi:MAG TPA: GxxExxY protein [Tepidisphaeraceae bacterium]|jgi:GxxExxY protein|nr:GxxExxY protein [Tepidisphaeraceae bacterium]
MGFGESTSERVEQTAKTIVDAALQVHRTLGPGLLESVYSICLAHELRLRGSRVDREVELPIVYGGVTIEAGLRLDLIVDDCVIVEVKAVDRMIPVFEAQILTYLRLTGHTLGLLINFNVPLIKDGIKRVVLSRT